MSHIDDLIQRLCPNGVEFKPLGDVGELVRGNGIQKSDFRESGVGCIHYGQIHTHYGTWAKVRRIGGEALGKIRIPVPPLEVQREIVCVLDLFQSLEAELEARLRQYSHYRDSLLAFADRPDVPWLEMRAVGEFFRGKRFTKDDYVEDGGVSCIHYGEIYTHYRPLVASSAARPYHAGANRRLKMRQPRLQSFRLGTEAFDFPGALPGQVPVCLKQACDAMTFLSVGAAF